MIGTLEDMYTALKKLGPDTTLICELFLKYVNKTSKAYSKTDKIKYMREYARLLVEYEKYKSIPGYAKDVKNLSTIFIKKKHDSIEPEDKKYLLQALEKSKSTLGSKFLHNQAKGRSAKVLQGGSAVLGLGSTLIPAGPLATSFKIGAALAKGADLFIDKPEKEKDIDQALKTAVRAAMDRNNNDKEFKSFITAILATGHNFGHNFNIPLSDIIEEVPAEIGDLLTKIADSDTAIPTQSDILDTIKKTIESSLEKVSTDTRDTTKKVTREDKLESLHNNIQLAREVIDLGTLLLNDLANPEIANTCNIIASNTVDIAYSAARFFLGDIGLTSLVLTTAKNLFFIGQAIWSSSTDGTDKIYNDSYKSVDDMLSEIETKIDVLHQNQIKIVTDLREMLKLLKDGNKDVLQRLLQLEINIIDYIQEDSRFHEMDKLAKSTDKLGLLLIQPKDQFSESFFNNYLMNIYNYALRTARGNAFSGFTTQDLSPDTWVAQIEKKDRIDLVFGMLNQLAQVNSINQDVQYRRLARLITNESVIANPIEWQRGTLLFLAALAYRQANEVDFDLNPYVNLIHALRQTGEQINNAVMKFTSQEYIATVESKFKDEVNRIIETIDSSLITNFLTAAYAEFSGLYPKLAKSIDQTTFCYGYNHPVSTSIGSTYQARFAQGPIAGAVSDTYHYTILYSVPDKTLKKPGARYFSDNIGKANGYRLFELDRNVLDLIFFAQNIGLITLTTIKTTHGLPASRTPTSWTATIKYDLTQYSLKFITGPYAGLILNEFYQASSQYSAVSCCYYRTSWRTAIQSHFKADLTKIADTMPAPLDKNFNFAGITFIDFLSIQINILIANLRVNIPSEVLRDSNVLGPLIANSQILQLNSYLRLLVQLRLLCLADEITIEDLSLARTSEYYSKNDLLLLLMKLILERNVVFFSTPSGERSVYSLQDSADMENNLADLLRSNLEKYWLAPIDELLLMCNYSPDSEPKGLPFVEETLNEIDLFLKALPQKNTSSIPYSPPNAASATLDALPTLKAAAKPAPKSTIKPIPVTSSPRPAKSLFGLDYHEMPRDHHCFYHAMAYYLNVGPTKKSEEQFVTDLRNEIADHIRDNLQLYEVALRNERNMEPQKCIDSIRKNEWAGDIEISALMRIYKRPIFIVDRANNSSYLRVQNSYVMNDYPGALPIFAYYNGSNHYNALHPNGEYPLNIIIEFFRWQDRTKYPDELAYCSKYGRNQDWPKFHELVKQPHTKTNKLYFATYGLFWATFHRNEHEIKWFKARKAADTLVFQRKNQQGKQEKYVIRATDVVNTNYLFKAAVITPAHSEAPSTRQSEAVPLKGPHDDNLLIKLLLQGTVTNNKPKEKLDLEYEELSYKISNDNIVIDITPAIVDAFPGSDEETKRNAQIAKRGKIVTDIKQSLAALINEPSDSSEIKVSKENRSITLSPYIIGKLDALALKSTTRSATLINALNVVRTIRSLQSKTAQLPLVQATLSKLLQESNPLFSIRDTDNRKHIVINSNNEELAQHIRDALFHGLGIALKLDNQTRDKIFQADGLGKDNAHSHSVSCSSNDFNKYLLPHQNSSSMNMRR